MNLIECVKFLGDCGYRIEPHKKGYSVWIYEIRYRMSTDEVVKLAKDLMFFG